MLVLKKEGEEMAKYVMNFESNLKSSIFKELICIKCPMGCPLQVKLENNQGVSIKGDVCKIGNEYVQKECTSLTRIVTPSFVAEGGKVGVVKEVLIENPTIDELRTDGVFMINFLF